MQSAAAIVVGDLVAADATEAQELNGPLGRGELGRQALLCRLLADRLLGLQQLQLDGLLVEERLRQGALTLLILLARPPGRFGLLPLLFVALDLYRPSVTERDTRGKVARGSAAAVYPACAP